MATVMLLSSTTVSGQTSRIRSFLSTTSPRCSSKTARISRALPERAIGCPSRQSQRRDRLRRNGPNSRMEAPSHIWKFYCSVRYSDDRYYVVQAGLQFPVGGKPPNATTTLVKPEPTSDVRNYLVSGRYDKDINKRLL